jgi:hypothetical protein
MPETNGLCYLLLSRSYPNPGEKQGLERCENSALGPEWISKIRPGRQSWVAATNLDS